jgi:hypothetical protein
MKVREADSGSSAKPSVACWAAAYGLIVLMARFCSKSVREIEKVLSGSLKVAAAAFGKCEQEGMRGGEGIMVTVVDYDTGDAQGFFHFNEEFWDGRWLRQIDWEMFQVCSVFV